MGGVVQAHGGLLRGLPVTSAEPSTLAPGLLKFVQSLTIIAWQRRRFREHWTHVSQRGSPGRPAVGKEIQDLIRRLSRANSDWGSPRIVGELGKLGIKVAKS